MIWKWLWKDYCIPVKKIFKNILHVSLENFHMKIFFKSIYLVFIKWNFKLSTSQIFKMNFSSKIKVNKKFIKLCSLLNVDIFSLEFWNVRIKMFSLLVNYYTFIYYINALTYTCIYTILLILLYFTFTYLFTFSYLKEMLQKWGEAKVLVHHNCWRLILESIKVWNSKEKAIIINKIYFWLEKELLPMC